MKVGFSTACLYGYSLERVFEVAREVNADGLELVARQGMGPESALWLNRLCERFGVAIYSIHTPIHLLTSQYLPAVAYEEVMRLALAIPTVRVVVFHAPRVFSNGNGPGLNYSRALRACARLAEGSRVRIGLENVSLAGNGGRAKYLMDDLGELKRFADEQNLALTFDTSHAGSAGVPLLDAFRLVAERVENIHFSDMKSFSLPIRLTLLHSAVREHQIPGQGCLPLRDLLGALERRSYGGLLTLELSPLAIRSWSEALAREALAQAISFCRNHRLGLEMERDG